MTSALDHLTNWLWVAFIAVFSWAWQIDRRVARHDTLQPEMARDIKELHEKMDRLIDKLL